MIKKRFKKQSYSKQSISLSSLVLSKTFKLIGLSVFFLVLVLGVRMANAQIANSAKFNKSEGDTLTAEEWNELIKNFVTRDSSLASGETQSMWGSFGIGVSKPLANSSVSLEAEKIIKASGFLGSISAAYITPGLFGSESTSGNYFFPRSLIIGASNYNLGSGANLLEAQVSNSSHASSNLLLFKKGNNEVLKLITGSGTGNSQLVFNGLIKMSSDNIVSPQDVINKGYLESALTEGIGEAIAGINFWNQSGNNLVASSSNWNVGIGLSNPGARLGIGGEKDGIALKIINGIDGTPFVIKDSSDTNELLKVDQYGNLEIAGKFILKSSLKIGSEPGEICNTESAGTIKHEAGSGQTFICNGERWLNQNNCGLVADKIGSVYYVYSTVMIGGQCWLAENLRSGSLFNMGSNVNNSNNVVEKWCYGNNDAGCKSDGALYQWNEVMKGSKVSGAQGACPAGWHIPSDTEWDILEETINGLAGEHAATNGAGQALKRLNLSSGTDIAGFDSILAGYRTTGGSHSGRNSSQYYWTSTQQTDGGNIWVRQLSTGNNITRSAQSPNNGYSARCIKD